MSSYSLRMELAAISFAAFVVLGAILYSSTIIYSNVSRDHPALAHPPGLRLAPINLFLGPQCKWRTPTYDVPQNIDFHKTVVAAFPSEENNVIHLMEALIGFGKFLPSSHITFAYFVFCSMLTSHSFIFSFLMHL